MPEDKTKTEKAPKAASNNYKGTPVPSPIVMNNEHLAAFLIDGDVMPKMRDAIVVSFRGQTFTGIVRVVAKGNIVAIATR